MKRTKDLNYLCLCAFNVFNTKVSQFELNYWNKWTFPQHSNLLRCTCIYIYIYIYRDFFFIGAPPVCHLSFVRDSEKMASLLLSSHFYQWSFPSHGTHQCCRLPCWGGKWVEICTCRLCEKDAFHKKTWQLGNHGNCWRDYSYNEVCLIQRRM